MKFSLILLACYIGFLSCFPCQDAPVRVASRIGSGIALTQDNTHHEDEAGDFCSPFCTCSCCATVHISPAIVGYAWPAPLIISAEKSFQYKSSFTQNNAGLIWQPPRLV